MTLINFSRRTTLTVIASSFALAACGQANNRPILKVGSQKGSTKALMLASGALENAPFDVEWSEFPAAQHLIEAVGSGAVDVGLAGDAPFQFAYQSGQPIKAISVQAATTTAPREALSVIVPPGSAIRTVSDLWGKSIATTRGSIGHYLVLRALAQAGLPANAVRMTWLAPGDAKAAFNSGALDAWAIWTPYLTAALAEKARVIVDSGTLVPGYGFEVANDKAIETKRPLLADFVARESRALAWADTHVDAYAKVLVTETGLPLAIAKIMAEKFRRGLVPVDQRVLSDQQAILDTFQQAGEIKVRRPLADAFEDLGSH